MYTLYGIPNCNTVKKARTWLAENQIGYTFHDYKKSGIAPEKVDSWFGQLSWEKFVNKAGTTWRGLTEDEKSSVKDADSAKKIMISHTSVIKRPVIEDETGKVVAVGFAEGDYETSFK